MKIGTPLDPRNRSIAEFGRLNSEVTDITGDSDAAQPTWRRIRFSHRRRWPLRPQPPCALEFPQRCGHRPTQASQ
jgi:hypothetical protein